MGNYYAGMLNTRYGNELKHHGIIGQKWGLRRFQNEDGSLTPAGRERYGYSSKKKGNEDSGQVQKSGMSPKNLLASLAYDMRRDKLNSLSSREKRKLQSHMQGRDDMAQKYKMVTEAAKEMNKARKQVPPLKENSKTYKELRNRVIDEGADYYVMEFGLSKDEARKWASEEDEILKDEIDRAYLNTSQHPAAKAYREKRETYLDLHRDLSNDVNETIRTTLGNNLNLGQKNKATRAIYDSMIEKIKSQSSDIPKTGMPDKYKKDRATRYFERENNQEDLERYLNMDRRSQKQVKKAIDKLERPGYYEHVMYTNPIWHRVGEKLRDKRVDKAEDRLNDLMSGNSKGSKFDGSPKAGTSTNPQDYGSAEFEKNYKKYQRLQGTKSLLGGDHSKDESVKVLTDYQNEIYKNRNKLRNKEKSDYKNSVADIASKYTDKYAKAVLKDMGYDTSPESIAWLRQQPWFYLGGASEIVF